MSALLIKIVIIVCMLFTGLNAYAYPFKQSYYDGDPFHFVFVTSSTTDATSANIDDYNDFVQNAAEGAGIGTQLGLTWRAFISTPSVYAVDNVAVQHRLFTLDDQHLATGSVDFYDGTLLNAIDHSEQAQNVNRHVWTGTATNGEAAAGFEAGSASGITQIGRSIGTGVSWTDFETATATWTGYSLYAVSNPVVYDAGAFAPVPIPPSILLMASGLMGCIAGRRWMRR